MNTAKRVIKNTGFLYAKMGITMFISLYTTRLILNALGASDFGIFNVVGGAIAMLGFLHAAMSGATQRFMSYYEGKGDMEKQKYIFNVSSVLHVVIALFLALILFIAGVFFFNGILNIPSDRILAAKVIYGSLILSTVFTVMSVPYEAVLNAHENMLYYSIVGVLESFLSLIVAFVIVFYAGDKLIIYGILMAAIPFISRTVMQVYCRRKYGECVIAPRKYWDKGMMKDMTSFAGWSFFSNAARMLSGYGSGVILNHFFGTILNAANGVSGQINGQLLAFSNNMMKAVNPVIVKNEGGGNRKAMYKATFWACKMAVLIYAFFAIPFYLEADFIVTLWLKTPPDYAVLFIKIIICQVLIEQITLPLGTSIAAIGRIKNFTLVTSFLWFVYLPILFFLYKKGAPPETMKYMALVIAFLISAYRIFYSYKFGEMILKEYFTNVVLNSGGIILITGFLSYGIRIAVIQYITNDNWVRLIIICFFSSLTLLSIFILTNINSKDRKKLLIKVQTYFRK